MEFYVSMAIIAMLGYGVTSIIYKIAGKDIDSVSMTFFTSLFIALFTFFIWYFTKDKHITSKGIWYAGISGLIAAVAFVAFITSIQGGKVSIASTLRSLSFLVTSVIAIVFLAEKVPLTKILGIILAAVAAILLAF
ncbi:MAG: hypothetical protein FJZ04_03385 [Candidatus Moranbacteria bacterium]|nr:hypothetical protein [Candidatus Moranbacteria bacterium]